MTKNSSLRYGLDFGTSNTLVSVKLDGNVATLPINLENKSEILESAIYFKDGTLLFGSAGIEKYIEDVAKSDVNHLNSLSESDFYANKPSLQNKNRLLRSFKTSLSRSLGAKTGIGETTYTVDDIVTIFLHEVKKRADALVGEKVTRVTVGRPVKFAGDEAGGSFIQDRLEKCLRDVGFEDIIFEYEPVAAAHRYSTNSKERIFVFDFGGGTLDTSIVDLNTNKVLGTNGIAIGGDVLDGRIFKTYFSKYFGGTLKYRNDELDYPNWAVEQIIDWSEAEKLRNNEFISFLHSLKNRSSSQFTVDLIEYFIKRNLTYIFRKKIIESKETISTNSESDFYFESGPFNISEKISREVFENKISDLLSQSKRVVLDTLETAKLTPVDIEKVVMTGGSSLVPAFQELLTGIFGDKLVIFEPFTAVSKGLAMSDGK